MALSAERDTPTREPRIRNLPVKAATTIYAGSIVMLSGAVAIPAKTATGLVGLGRAEETVANTGGDGAARVNVRRGVFRFKNSSADPVTLADLGNDVYAVDDETIAKTIDTDQRSKCGKLFDLDASGAWVEF